MKLKRKTIILGSVILFVVVAAAAGFYIHQKQNKKCYETLSGGCLPDGKCAAPNDAIVDCEKLRQNPTKTDWFGNE